MNRYPRPPAPTSTDENGPDTDGDESDAVRDREYDVPGVGPCRNCGHTVESAATQCRSCGYTADPERNRAARFTSLVYGLVLVGTIVGAPLGVVFLWRAYRHHRSMNGQVVQPAYAPPPSTTLLSRCKALLSTRS